MPTTHAEQFGLYDVNDDCWYGNELGPVLFPSEDIARAAATIVYMQLEGKHRIEARPYDGGATRSKDELPTKITPLQALRRAEKGWIP
jgi:hypothetical protein